MTERDRVVPTGGSDPQPRPRGATPPGEESPDRRHRPAGWRRQDEPPEVETDGGTEREFVDERTRQTGFEWGPGKERDNEGDPGEKTDDDDEGDPTEGSPKEQPPEQDETDESTFGDEPPPQYETDEQAVIDRYEGLLAERHAEKTRKITRSSDREPSRLRRVKLRLLRLLGLR